MEVLGSNLALYNVFIYTMEPPQPEIEANINFFLALFEKLREPDETCNIFYTHDNTMESTQPEIEANVNFFLALFKKLREGDETCNICYSPFSISVVLAMLYRVCGGNTAAQILQVLRLSGAKQPTKKTEKPMMTLSHMKKELQLQLEQTSRSEYSLKQDLTQVKSEEDICAVIYQHFCESTKGFVLDIGNWLYFEEHIYTFVEGFIAKNKANYKAELDKLAKTGQIKKLIRYQLEEDIKLLLINTIDFKGKWKHAFKNLCATVQWPFHINTNDTKNVMMMFQQDRFNLFDIPEVNCQILEMPYEGDVFSMLIFLPNGIEDSTTGLEKLLWELTYDKIMEWTCSDQCCSLVKVGLPRFRMEFSYDLTVQLTSMGMVDAFDRKKSDFSGISTEKDCTLLSFHHNASVEVNERGTLAGAVTGFGGESHHQLFGSSNDPKEPKYPKYFIADHPFLFFIRYNPCNTILFAGQYTSP
ncbi:leukocyte elastase inhibitor-like [Stigmatopora argus]